MLKMTMIGHIGGDAVVRDVNGRKAISFNIAHTEKFKDRNGNQNDKTTWVRCTLWRDADKAGIAQYLLKGTQVFVEGNPSANAFINKEGAAQASLELTVFGIELLGSSNRSSSDSNSYNPNNNKDDNPKTNQTVTQADNAYDPGKIDDDLPF